MNGHASGPKEMSLVKLRLASLTVLALLAGCSQRGEIADGGVYATRSPCPLVGVPAGTGDITLFNPANSAAASAIDVSATMTNVRSTCSTVGSEVVSTVSFDVLAVRRDASAARQVVLPFFNTVVQGGSQVVAKKVGAVGLNFAAGSQRAQTSGQATSRVSLAAATLPENVRKLLTRPRKAGEAEAAIDPLADPAVRDAVARATFEQLIGFQMTEAQLRYNVTR
ncbi:MAG: hypothetical protein ABIQ32_04645 [Sphingomicrobium sp.]